MIRFDESRETYDSTNPRFCIEYSNIRIRSNKNAVHWIQALLTRISNPIFQINVQNSTSAPTFDRSGPGRGISKVALDRWFLDLKPSGPTDLLN
jgi:hypothetical protein